MARLKRSSTVLDKAMRRIAGMRSISETLEFGEGLNLTEYDARIQALQTRLGNYNTMLSTLDEMAGQIALLEQELRSYSEKMLMAVAARYGRDSLQYMQAGGTLRKRSVRRSGATPSVSSATPTPVVATAIAEKAKTNGKGARVTLN